MTQKEALKKLGERLTLTLPHYFDKPVRVVLVGCGWKWSEDRGVYTQCDVMDATGTIYYCKAGDLNE